LLTNTQTLDLTGTHSAPIMPNAAYTAYEPETVLAIRQLSNSRS